MDKVKSIVADVIKELSHSKVLNIPPPDENISSHHGDSSDFESPSTTKKAKTKHPKKGTSSKKVKTKRSLKEAPQIQRPSKQQKVDVAEEEESNITLGRLNYRCNPSYLTRAIVKLSDAQKTWVSENGFKDILGINMYGLPTQIGYYVVDNFDDDTLTLKTRCGNIQITEELVKEMYGVPSGKFKITEVNVVDAGDETTRLWRAQYESRIVRLNDVVTMLETSRVVDRQFILNFLVLVASVLGKCTKGGGANQKILHMLTEDVDVNQLNWCSYFMECLKDSKKLWRRDDAKEYYAGPATLLVVRNIFLKLSLY